MDDCLCDYKSSHEAYRKTYPDIEYPQSIEGFFEGLSPLKGALDTVRWLDSFDEFEVYILSAPSIMNPKCYTEKRLWVENHLGLEFVDKLILSCHKHLNVGDYLIDDHVSGKGQEHFQGKLIHFGSGEFPDWFAVRNYFEEVVLKYRL